MPSDPLLYIVGAVIALSLIWKFFSERKPKTFPEVEREAELQLISHNTDEIKRFCRVKGDYMKEETHKALVSRIQELESDKEYYDDMVKSKIDSL